MGVFKRNKSQAAAEHPQQGGCLAGSELQAELGDKVESRVDPRLQIEHVEQAAHTSQTQRCEQTAQSPLASFQKDAFLSRALERVLGELAQGALIGGASDRAQCEMHEMSGSLQLSQLDESLERQAEIPHAGVQKERLDEQADKGCDKRVIVGLSGGVDSAMLLVYASLLASKYQLKITALHIHHGLQQPADAWAAHSQALCEMLGVEFIFKRVAVNETSGLGMEASARQARYQAYYEVAQERACYDYLLAHHQNDQAETVLLRLLRGTGAQGMAAMSAMSEYEGVRYHRPWLDVPRARILASATQWGELTGWHPVQDPTNHDTAYTRAAVRELLVPSLDARWPSWQSNVIRHAQLMQENSLLLSDLAEIDLANLELSEDKRSFSLIAWRELSEHRQANVLRYWLGLQGVLMPSQARMQEWMRQLRSVHQMGTDRKVEFKHQGAVIRLVRGRVEFER